MNTVGDAIQAAMRAVMRGLEVVTKVVWEGGKWVAKQSLELVEKVAELPVAAANAGFGLLSALGPKGGGQKTQAALRQQQQALAQQAQQQAQPERDPYSAETAAARRYMRDRLAGRESPAEVTRALGDNLRDYLDYLNDDERQVLLSAPRNHVRALVRQPLSHEVPGVRPAAVFLAEPQDPRQLTRLNGEVLERRPREYEHDVAEFNEFKKPAPIEQLGPRLAVDNSAARDFAASVERAKRELDEIFKEVKEVNGGRGVPAYTPPAPANDASWRPRLV